MNIAAALRKLIAKPYRTVTASDAGQQVDAGAVLLDVREPSEWHAGHAPKARHIPLGQLTERLHELPADRPVIAVCRSGGRSARAAALLADEGRDVSDLTGGMNAWARAGLPVVADGGGPGRIS